MAEANKEEEKKPRRRPKKAKGHGGHHGGAWKVAFADFMTAMMALFLVLWLVSQADTKLKEAIANYFRAPGVFDTIQGGILAGAKSVSREPTNLTLKDDEQALTGVAKALDKKFASKPEFSKHKDQIKIEITPDGLKIQIIDKAERVSFPSGSAELTDEAKLILTEIAASICELPNKINIGGHTDSHLFSTMRPNYTNWELSADRANAARRVLESVCVKPGQINRIVGYADTEPLVREDPYAPANRRISITLLRQGVTLLTDNPAENRPPDLKTQPQTQNLPEKNKTVKPAPERTVPAPPAKETSGAEEKTQEKSTEGKTNENKLKKEGKVIVGEADQVPDKPVIKE